MKLRDIMTKDIEVVNPDSALREAAKMMRDADTGFLPVCDGEQLIGTLTDRDIAIRSTAEGQDPSAAKVREVMSEELVFAYEDQDSNEAAQIMSERQIRRLPVVNRDNRLVGVVSLGDLAVQTSDDDVVGQTIQDVSQPGGEHNK